MPKAVSKRQYRFMQALAHGAHFDHPRGTPPKSVAEKYTSTDEGAPESKNNDRGGNWDKHKDEKHKKKLKKAFSEFYKGKGAGTIVLDKDGKILVGQGWDGKWQTPGGKVDGNEDFDEAAHRELREEAGIVAGPMTELNSFNMNGNDSKTFLVHSFTGTPKDSTELKNLKFVDANSLLDMDLRDCSQKGIEAYISTSLNKSTRLQDMLAVEKLQKNIIRGGARSDVVFDVSHGDALKLVGNGCFRWLKGVVDSMGDEDFKEARLDNHIISIRKHASDVYSGRISDGHKMIHQFTNKSLPQVCADIMSVFEWYSDDDEHVFDILDEDNLSDDAIHGGLSVLTENYTKHNLANIYVEMENIREEIRHGNAVDLQQVEEKIMKLFDKLEDTTQKVIEQHNKLAQDAGGEIESLEAKLRDLANKVDELTKKPESVEAYQSRPVNPDKIYNSQYMYLPKPSIEIEPNGKIKISFNKEWTDMEKSNFLNDMKAKIVRRE
jgi:8-oxo-dGTP pyrophosphatase MutT (NUDIX family)